MLTQIYPIAFLVSLGALTGWFYYKEDEKRSGLLRSVFYTSLVVFFLSAFFSEATIVYKIKTIGRELAILAVIPLFLSFFRKNKITFLVLLFAVLGGLDYFYFDELKASFSSKSQEKQAQFFNADEHGELLVRLKTSHKIAAISNVLEEFGATYTAAFDPADKDATELDDAFLIDIQKNKESNFEELRSLLQNDPAVEWVEINERYSFSPIELAPSRKLPDSNLKYGLNDPEVSKLWGFEAMNMDALYKLLKTVTPKRKALIAILDTGVEASHEDISANFQSIDLKYDSDKVGHGTHCAGIAAAVSNNHLGVASFSQSNEFTKVTSVKVLAGAGYGTQKMVIDGIIKAADAGADVLSVSLGGLSNDLIEKAFTEAIEYANKKGAIVVVAAGNSNDNASHYSPANTPGVITVSAIDTALAKASFSNTVQDIEMGVAAPGVNIVSTYMGNKYVALSGTSMATPYVSGLVGLMKSIKPELTTKEVYEILNATGKEIEGNSDTGKLIQPALAISRLLENI